MFSAMQNLASQDFFGQVCAIRHAGLFLLAAPQSGAGGEGPSMVQTFVFMGLIFVVFWFFMIRPQRQKQKQREAMLKTIEKNDRVVTIGGVRGSVAKVSDETVSIKVDDNCKIEFSRSAIAEVLLDEKENARRRSEILNSGKQNGAAKIKKDKDEKAEDNDKQIKGEEGAL